jgi:hypothetical protein
MSENKTLELVAQAVIEVWEARAALDDTRARLLSAAAGSETQVL